MICPNKSNRGPLEKKEKKEEENKCGSLPTADIVGAVGKTGLIIMRIQPNLFEIVAVVLVVFVIVVDAVLLLLLFWFSSLSLFLFCSCF